MITNDDLLPFELPTNKSAMIKVLGVGGGGSNAVNHMYNLGIEGVDFIISNTDYQALRGSVVPVKIQLGATLTKGLGAGNKPDKGREAAIESIEDIKREISSDTKMIFITAGMGGGTGTGAAPIISEAAKELGILTIGIVTLPFRYEGRKRLQQAVEGISEMRKHVDSLLIVNNEKLREMYGDFEARKAFGKADDILSIAARGIAEIITKEGHINVDFADVSTVMTNSGIALMGSGHASGDNRAEVAVKAALNSPLLDNNDINGANDILLNITSGKKEATMDEIGFINEYVQEAAGNNADLIWGSSTDESLGDNLSVTVIATGFGEEDISEIYANMPEKETVRRIIKDEKQKYNTKKYGNDRQKKPHDLYNGVPFEINNSDDDIFLLSNNNIKQNTKIRQKKEIYQRQTKRTDIRLKAARKNTVANKKKKIKKIRLY